MDALGDCPQVSEGHTVVGALENQVVYERCLVSESIHEELYFVKDTNVILLVLNLEIAIRATIRHVNHVLSINELGKLFIAGSTSPRSVMKNTLSDDFEVRGRVGRRYKRQGACHLVSI